MNTTIITVTRDRAEDLAVLLGQLEQWLWHCGDQTIADLTGRLGTSAWPLTLGRLTRHRVELRQRLDRQ